MGRALWVVALGGAAGSVLRFSLGLALSQAGATARLPLSTLAVNIAGSLAIGAVSGWLARMPAASPDMRHFVVTGILGGFTTYSAFAMETVALAQAGTPTLALLHIAAHIVLGIGAAWCGAWLTS
jgi:CrcB protein